MNIILDLELQLSDIQHIVYGDALITLSDAAKQRIETSFEFLRRFSSDKVIYGINTGFGPMAQYRVNDSHLNELQYNIIRSHSAGAGAPMDDAFVKAAMLARLGTLVQGYSGIHISVAELLVEFINRNIIPRVPRHGSVGASGDLVQLSHIALALIGEGEVHYQGRWRKTSEVMTETGLKPIEMHIREGLCITNGTSMMSGIAAINLIHAKNLLRHSLIASALTNEIAGSYDDFLSEELHSAKRHDGQCYIAKMMTEILRGSRCIRKRETELYNSGHAQESKFQHKVQPYYSLRCIPQVIGPVYDALENAISVTEREYTSACDNPIVDYRTKNVYHGGNFHGDYISYEMDKIKIGITKMTMLAERQLNYLCHDRINEILPPFLNLGVLGLNYGIQACQFTATSTTAESQTLSMPNSIHSIPNNNDNQDIVSMGTNSALLTNMVVENAYQVMAILFIALVQGVDCLQLHDKLAPNTKAVYDEIRSFIPVFVEDTPKYEEIERVINYLKKDISL